MGRQITLDTRDQQRISALAALDSGQVSPSEAAVGLGISVRQLRRIRARYHQDGAAGIVHAGRGQVPVNACPPDLRDRVVALYREDYKGFNQEHFTEKLLEDHQIDLSRSTVRRMLAHAGIAAPSPQKRSRHRRRRVRRAKAGALIQMDGSDHDWLEGRGPRLTLIGGIDDATNQTWARFYFTENMNGYIEVVRGIVRENGIPAAVYLDRTSLMLTERRTEAKEQHLSHFGKSLVRMGVVMIRARSPQAKGRIERLWRTMQDRLTSELRAKNVASLEGANKLLVTYLRRHNMRFRKEPLDAEAAWRDWDLPIGIDDAICAIHTRTARLDNTVTLGSQVLQLEPGPDGESWGRRRISIHEHPDGTLRTFHGHTFVPSSPFGVREDRSSAA